MHHHTGARKHRGKWRIRHGLEARIGGHVSRRGLLPPHHQQRTRTQPLRCLHRMLEERARRVHAGGTQREHDGRFARVQERLQLRIGRLLRVITIVPREAGDARVARITFQRSAQQRRPDAQVQVGLRGATRQVPTQRRQAKLAAHAIQRRIQRPSQHQSTHRQIHAHPEPRRIGRTQRLHHQRIVRVAPQQRRGRHRHRSHTALKFAGPWRAEQDGVMHHHIGLQLADQFAHAPHQRGHLGQQQRTHDGQWPAQAVHHWLLADHVTDVHGGTKRRERQPAALDLRLVVRIGGKRGRVPRALQRRRDVHERMHVAMRTNGEQEHVHGRVAALKRRHTCRAHRGASGLHALHVQADGHAAKVEIRRVVEKPEALHPAHIAETVVFQHATQDVE